MSTNAGSDADRPRVVVGVDGSDASTRALEWAAIQAERTAALLEIHTVYVPGLLFIPPDEVNELTTELLDEAAERARSVAPGVATLGKAHDDVAPATALIEASNGATLLVVGSRGHGGFLGLTLGSVSQKCSRHAQAPVVIVR
jgi:nucleotide-binding universal stress UspA family protein